MLSPEMRKSLATQLNKLIDIPFLDESSEQAAIETLLDKLLGPLESVAPPSEEIESAKGDPVKESGMKTSMVEKLNKMIDIPFANEEQEAMALNLVVDYFMKDKMGQQQATSAASTSTAAT